MACSVKYCVVLAISVHCITAVESKTAVDVIERFINVRSDIYVTASLPDLRHSNHSVLRLGT